MEVGLKVWTYFRSEHLNKVAMVNLVRGMKRALFGVSLEDRPLIGAATSSFDGNFHLFVEETSPGVRSTQWRGDGRDQGIGSYKADAEGYR